MKAMLISSEFPPFAGGAGIYTADLAESLSRLGVKVIVLAPKYVVNYSVWDKKQNYKIIRFFEMNSKKIHRLIQCIKIMWYLSKERPQIIHSTDSGAHKRLALLSFFIPMKVILTIHGSEVYKYERDKAIPKLNKNIEYLLVKTLIEKSIMICVSNSTKCLLTQKFILKDNRCTVVYNGVNLRKFGKSNFGDIEKIKNKYDIKGPVLLSVSRLSENKGNDKVLEALNTIKLHFPTIKYLIIGEGDFQNKLSLKIKELNLLENVVLVGKVDPYKLTPFYNISDVFVLPSRRESFGLVYVEAYYHKIPVIGANEGGVPEVIQNGVTGYTVNPNDHKEIADSIIKLLSNKQMAKLMGERGYKLAIEKFNSDRMAHETFNIYKNAKIS